MKYLLPILFLCLSFSCQEESSSADVISTTPAPAEEMVTVKTEAEIVIDNAIAAHGGERYETANYGFVFRKKSYTFLNDGPRYVYTAKEEKEGKLIEDRLDNEGVSRKVNGKAIELTEKQRASTLEAVNSVVYFATLPHKLNDPAVHKKYVGKTSIKGKNYHVILVTFQEDGGGTDYDDQYHYWINQETDLIDYLAYNYQVSGGGVRFRSAYNTRKVDGIIFQDYVNYKAPIGTHLADLPALYEKDELKELSRIETEDVINLRESR